MAVVTAIAANVVSKLSDYLIAPVGRQFGYLLCYKSYIEDLKYEVKELEIARERVQHLVDEASYDGKPIYTDVKYWLESVMEEAEEAENLLKHGESAKNSCFHGWLLHPMVRHPIGRKVKKTTQVIQGLREKSSSSVFQNVYYGNNEELQDLRALTKEDVMKAIVDDKVCVIGVYGPGGVGKSKLLEDIERLVKEEKLFDVVVVAKVSRNPDLKRIQGEIAYALGLKLDEETAYGRANLLNRRLKSGPKKNILIILDDLWKKLELKEVGIPCGYDNNVRGCKLLLTSRYRDVLRCDMGTDREFRLNELEHGEARRLFENMVGNKIHDPDVEPWVDGVVQSCGGLPLLIVSLAKRLKHGDLAAWRNASTNIDASDVKSLLELNYNDLKEERTRSLFLICALVSGNIHLRDSLIYCMGLGLFKNYSNTIENARDRLIVDLHSLQDSTLLLDSDNKEEFRMHDIFVDVAISIASVEWNALVGRKDCGFREWSEDELRKCTAMSFPWVGIAELPEKLDCPNLRMLLLLEHSPSLKIPDSFFESMEKLQVLDLTGLSFTTLPSSIAFLKNLKSLCLDRCHLGNVTILGMLKGLEFLSFAGSTIIWLPKEIGELTKLRFLDLTGCVGLKVIEPGVLEKLVNMEELYMGDSFDHWEAEDEAPRSNASLAELKNMKKLSTLYIAIPNCSYLSRDLPFERLINYRIQIGDILDWSGENKESRTLKLKLDSGHLLMEEWMQRTQDLHLVGLQDGNDSIPDLAIGGFQELKHLHVQNIPTLRYVVPSSEGVHRTILTRLESLILKNLNNLEKVCCGYLAPESFSKLNLVKVDNCGEIKHLFPLSMKRILSQLEDIEICRCPLMQQIVLNAEANEDGDELGNDTEVKLCNLRMLTLRNLPAMTSFCKIANHSVNFFDGQQLIKLQELEVITIERCQLIRGVFDLEGVTASGEVEILSRLRELNLSDLPSLGHIWNKNPQRTLCLQSLRTLKVQNCENLRFLFSSSMAKALGQIKEVEIANCKLMEEIIDVQEEELQEAATTDTLEFPLLTSLSLEEMPNLKTFSYGKYGIHCPSLTRLMIVGCPKMITFSSFERKQQSMTGDIGLQQAFSRINSDSSLPVFFNEKVHFPSLVELELSSMYELKRIWPKQLHGPSFTKLESITVGRCENLLHVFPSNSVDKLHSLNKIEVVECPSLEALFEPISLSDEKRRKPLVLSALKKMKLLNLPRMRDILKSDFKVTLAFPCLVEVVVSHCHSLPYLFSSATAITLDKLGVLDVSCCNNLRGIIAMEEGKGNDVGTFKFRHLSTLKLGYLEKLISFSLASCAGEGLHPLFDEKVVFPSMELMKISHLNNMEKIWLDELPSNAFSKLKMLIVEYCEKLSSIFSSDTILTGFPNLEKLTVTDCGSLQVVFQVQELNMSGAHSTSTFRLRELNLERLPRMKHVWRGHPCGTLTFERLKYLKVDKCLNLKSLFPVSVAKGLTQLEQLVVSYSLVEEIIAEEDGVEGDLFFPRLTALTLYYLPRLGSLYRNRHTSRWPLLKELRVTHCCKMWSSTFFYGEEVFQPLEQLTLGREDEDVMMRQSYMFDNLKELCLSCYHDQNVAFPSNFLLQRFPNLETLDVDCSSFEEIFPGDAFGHGGATSHGEITELEKPLRALRNLKRLGLNELWYLRQVWKDGSLMAEILKQIEVLSIFRCPSLSIVFPSPTLFHSLTNLRVEHCVVLVHLGTCSAVTSLVHLTHLILRDCGAMKDVITDDGNGAKEISFPKLEELILDRLPSLESFSSTDCAFRFPSLARIIATRCPKMNIFCKGVLRTPKLNKVLLHYQDDEGRWDGDLNTTLQTLST